MGSKRRQPSDSNPHPHPEHQVLLAADTNDDCSIDFEEFLHGVSHMDTGTVKKDTWKLEARLKKCEQVTDGALIYTRMQAR